MVAKSNVQVTFSLTQLGLDDEELQAQVQNLLPQLRDVDGVEDADLVAVTEVPEGSKALGGFLLGFLNAEVNPKNLKALFGFLGDRFGNKPIKISIKESSDGSRELNLEASSREEFDFAFQKAQEFLNQKSNSNNG
ncbi:sugar ABC transporter permease [Nostoc sp. FACHB-110]|uniref:sugar ABC transporter permease n=1 Tax=Nostoc sp. FACHB-110 TaxID=2692834 RepID=UPI00168307B1|nr:sugar ABC transporter permease [Nostoc sp. FACHB-110]MBD2441628.1 sugar ABC transporter permease [Nostoc sp. FACHB-110]